MVGEVAGDVLEVMTKRRGGSIDLLSQGTISIFGWVGVLLQVVNQLKEKLPEPLFEKLNCSLPIIGIDSGEYKVRALGTLQRRLRRRRMEVEDKAKASRE